MKVKMILPALTEAKSPFFEFYRWSSIFRGASTKDTISEKLRHVAYAGGWKKFEPMWDWIIRARRASNMLPMLETILTGFGSHAPGRSQHQIVDVQPGAPDSIITKPLTSS